LALEDIEDAKNHIKRHSAKSAKGNDDISYNDIYSIPNDELQKLFQGCLDNLDSPDVWLTTIIIGI